MSVLIIDAEYDVMDKSIATIFSHFTFSATEILIKPNLLGGFFPDQHVTTHPSVIEAVVSYFEKKGVSITVGDNPAGKGNLEERARKAGLYQAAHGHFEDISEGERVAVPSNYFSSLVVSKKVLHSKYVLNVPKFKTHMQSIITGAIKNMFGILPGEEESMVHCKARSLEDFSRALVDIYSIRPPDLTIMDAVIAMEGNGPSSGTLRHLGKVLASDNGVELDAVMAHMMGLNPRKVPMLAYAHEKGLGEISVEKISVEGELERIPHFKVPAPTFVQFVTPFSSAFYDFLAVRPHLNERKCVQCWECVEKCPVSALTRNEYPHIDRKFCVSCFCCVELCEHHAMEIPSRARSLFNSLFLKA